jgi:hypothetical protein
VAGIHAFADVMYLARSHYGYLSCGFSKDFVWDVIYCNSMAIILFKNDDFTYPFCNIVNQVSNNQMARYALSPIPS